MRNIESNSAAGIITGTMSAKEYARRQTVWHMNKQYQLIGKLRWPNPDEVRFVARIVESE